MTQSVGALVAELSANTASFQKDMGKAAAILNSHAAGMNKTVAGIELGISKIGKRFLTVLSVGAVVAFTKGVIDMGDQLHKTSQKLGISVEDLSAYQYAAKLADVSNEDLTQGIAKLGKSVVDGITNPMGDAAEAFRNLGFTTDELKNKSLGKIFEEIAPKIAGITDETTRLQYQTELFGKSGYHLQPLLSSLREATDEARRTGVTVSTDFAKSAEEFNDTISKMTSGLTSLAKNALLPVIKLFNELHKDRGESNLLDDISRIENGIVRLKKRTEEIQSGGSILGKLFKPDPGALERLESQLEAATERLRKFREIQNLNQTPLNDKPDRSIDPLTNKSQIKQYNDLLQEIEKATKQSQLAITTDEKVAALERMAIAGDEFIFKAKQLGLWAEAGKEATAQQMEIQKAFLDWTTAAQKEAAKKSQTPLQNLGDEWSNTTKQMEEATARWAQGSADALTDFVMTGKADFKGFADAIIRDLVRIFIQQQVIGSFGTSTTAGTGLLGLFGGMFAEGGNPPIGKASIVGENGPELIVPRSATTVVPNSALGGSTYVIDARGADREGLARLEGMIVQLDGSIERRSVSAWVRDRSRGGVTASFA